MIDHAHRIFGKSSSESGESRMIGRSIIKREAQELFEGIPVVDLGFQFGIGVDFKPLLKKQAFHKEKRWVGAVSLKAISNGIISQKQAFNSGPINDTIDFFHLLDGPVLFHSVKNGDVGESKIGFHIFKAHDSSKKYNLKELCQKTVHLSMQIMNNINTLHQFSG
jgi:hypothetical protein